MSEAPLLKDVFNDVLVSSMSEAIQNIYPEFNSNKFKQQILPFKSEESITFRAEKIAKALDVLLPLDFDESTQILFQSFPNESDDLKGLASFYFLPFGNFTVKRGLNQASLKTAYWFLGEITKRFTSEFAIRYFINEFPDETLNQFKIWVKSDNEHLRRLVSEGLRPKLPWAPNLKEFILNPAPIFPFLEKLKNDPALYVRKSVANNLNDIAKNQPDQVLEILERWKQENKKHTNWIIKHALRTLIKDGNLRALKIIGIDSNQNLKVENFKIRQTTIKTGENLDFSFEIKNASNESVDVLIDYNVYFMKANGSVASKTFKLTQKNMFENQSLMIEKKHSFKIITTRKYYSGTHQISLIVNGAESECFSFELKA